MILAGRLVLAEEALRMGLVNCVVGKGQIRQAVEKLARNLCCFPQKCMNKDRICVCQRDILFGHVKAAEFAHGISPIESEGRSGAARFA